MLCTFLDVFQNQETPFAFACFTTESSMELQKKGCACRSHQARPDLFTWPDHARIQLRRKLRLHTGNLFQKRSASTALVCNAQLSPVGSCYHMFGACQDMHNWIHSRACIHSSHPDCCPAGPERMLIRTGRAQRDMAFATVKAKVPCEIAEQDTK